MRSFEAIARPKIDGWLVKTVGALVAAIGGGLLLDARRSRVTPELALVATENSAGRAT